MRSRNALVTFGLFFLLSVPTAAEETYYPVIVDRVIDGDTVVGEVLLPWDIVIRNQRFRAASFDAIELKDPGGEKAKWALVKILGRSETLYIQPTHTSRDNFGRILGVWFYLDGKEYKRVRDFMAKEGHLKTKRRRRR